MEMHSKVGPVVLERDPEVDDTNDGEGHSYTNFLFHYIDKDGTLLSQGASGQRVPQQEAEVLKSLHKGDEVLFDYDRDGNIVGVQSYTSAATGRRNPDADTDYKNLDEDPDLSR